MAPPTNVKWDPSIGFTFVINTDGSYLGNSGRVAFGTILRREGNWINGISCYLGYSKILYTELVGIWKVSQLVWKDGVQSCVCLSDSLDAFHRYVVILWEISELLTRQ